ncbi:hypothetical protein POF50_019860 [Streptomyces sp. SL13]|uniref:Uncharacterized protein n=1 Tax=Streptantibioticus silvisoli TaxID=2705255 RepID=A0AA90H5W9_9ACTN|nr:hypothetical protein [Streptantibioticus silvisoli]MDI5971558.1 hypothetical protein [Streptantibioticus silvisoli]
MTAALPAGSSPAEEEPPPGEPLPPAPGPETEDVTGEREEWLSKLLYGRVTILAPNGMINTGVLYGGQRMNRGEGPAGESPAPPPEQAGPVPKADLDEALTAFVEPTWFGTARTKLDTGLLLLSGARRSGRRTTALNLLSRYPGPPILHAVDADADLSTWHPAENVKGYLLDGSPGMLRRGVVDRLRARLAAARTRMVVVLPDDPALLDRLEEELGEAPVPCLPPPATAIFARHFEHRVPSAADRDRRLGWVDGKDLAETLETGMAPAAVVEVVARLAAMNGPPADGSSVFDSVEGFDRREARLLVESLRNDPAKLAFLLSVCVFEGLDHRLIRAEADRLLTVAAGRLDITVPGPPDGSSAGVDVRNPEFVLRHSLSELLHAIRAVQSTVEIRHAGYPFRAEPVSFAERGRARALLEHMWRQYSRMGPLMTQWLEGIDNRVELTLPTGEFMGMAARWSGGSNSLGHIRELTRSDRWTSREIASYALGVAAKDALLAKEIKHRLREWSTQANWQSRWTVARMCGTEYGTTRPDEALGLLHRLAGVTSGGHLESVVLQATVALHNLFVRGDRDAVFQAVRDWADEDHPVAGIALRTFPALLNHDRDWFGGQLTSGGEWSGPIVDLTRRGLDEERHYANTCRVLLHWCVDAAESDELRSAVQMLLSRLAIDVSHGVLRLFVTIDRNEAPDPACKDIAAAALRDWREGGASSAHRAQPSPSRAEWTYT